MLRRKMDECKPLPSGTSDPSDPCFLDNGLCAAFVPGRGYENVGSPHRPICPCPHRGGLGESLVPPYTRGSVSLSFYVHAHTALVLF
jgi:hypothetical protein